MSCRRLVLFTGLLSAVSSGFGCAVGVPNGEQTDSLAARGQPTQSAGAGGSGGGAAGALAVPPVAVAGNTSRAPVNPQPNAGTGGVGAPGAGAGAGPVVAGGGGSGGVQAPAPIAGRTGNVAGGGAGAGATAMPGAPPTVTPPGGTRGCRGATLVAGNQNLTLSFGAAQRSYIAHVPRSIAPGSAAPLLVVLHDLTQTAAGAQAVLGLDALGDAQGFITVYPQGVSNSWNAGSCCAGNRDDSVGFVRAVVADAAEKSCVDARRVYATGMSNGGMLAFRLACEASDVFAAVAPVAADLRVAQCTPEQPVALIAFNGTSDTAVPFRGAVRSVATVREALGCNATATVERFELDRCDRFSGCDGGMEVTHCTDTGGAHVWSSTLGFDTNPMVWNFVSRFRLAE